MCGVIADGGGGANAYRAHNISRTDASRAEGSGDHGRIKSREDKDDRHRLPRKKTRSTLAMYRWMYCTSACGKYPGKYEHDPKVLLTSAQPYGIND